jgi:hypothetical protein
MPQCERVSGPFEKTACFAPINHSVSRGAKQWLYRCEPRCEPVSAAVGGYRSREGKNWLAAVPGKGWFTLFRLYGPKKEFFDLSWKLNDIEKVK